MIYRCRDAVCARNERVKGHQCVRCEAGKSTVAGNDRSGADTDCYTTITTCEGTSAGASSRGRQCAFPFTYAGTTSTECTTAAPSPSGELLLVGMAVEANFQGAGKWLKARIAKAHATDTYDLDYADGERSEKGVGRGMIRYTIDAKDAWCMTGTSGSGTWGKCKCGG